MAYIQEIREQLPDNALFYDNPSFDNSIIGYSVDGNPIYDFEQMVLEYMEDEGCSERKTLLIGLITIR